MKSSKPADFVFYEDVLDSIAPNSAYYFIGGRGVGKSRFIDKVRRDLDLKYPAMRETCLVQGSTPDALRTIIEYVELLESSHEFEQHIVIDDFDEAFNAASADDLRRKGRDGQWTGEALIDAIQNLTQDRRVKFVAVGSRSCDQVERSFDKRLTPDLDSDIARAATMFWSNAQSKISVYVLDPWSTGGGNDWRARVTSYFQTEFGELTYWKTWADQAIELTGGYPMLLDPTIRELGRIAVATFPDDSIESRIKNEGREDEIRKHLSSLLRNNGLMRIVKVIKALSSAEDTGVGEEYAGALPALGAALAELDGQTGPIDLAGDFAEDWRDFLHEKALLFRTRNGDFHVPCPLLVPYIQSLAPSSIQTVRSERAESDRRSIYLTPAGGSVGSGKLTYSPSDGEESSVHLHKRDWLLCNALYQARGVVLSIDKIKHELGFPSAQSVRSSISRLKDRFEPLNLGTKDLIINVKGVGYRMNLDP